MTGKWPNGEVDHINGIRDDNRWCNLRDVTKSENQRNAKIRKVNTSGFNGVDFHTKHNKWRARIYVDGRSELLGYFSNFFVACCVRKAAEQEHGYHPNHGRKV